MTGPITMHDAIRRWGAAAPATLALALFLNILPNTFMWDDWQQIFENALLRAPGGIIRIFNTNVWGFAGRDTNYYRPLMHLTFYGALHWFGFNPSGYHLISILLHALCSTLVLLLIRRWSGDSTIALFAALLFAAHPAHTENVCWISGYPDLEATLFILLAALIYTSPAERLKSRDFKWRIARVMGLALCSFLGLLAKETAIVIPAICLAWELFQRREDVVSALSRRTPPLDLPAPRDRWTDYLAMACGIAAYLALRVRALGGLMPFSMGQQLPPSVASFTKIALFYRYSAKLLWPVDLTAFYDFPLSETLLDRHVAAGLVVLALFVWLLAWLWRRREPAALGLVIFAVALAPAFWVPYSGFNLLAERYLYLPSLGFCWLVAWCLSAFSRHMGKRRGAVLLVGVLGAYSVRTEARNLDWRSEIPFYQQSLAAAPDLAELHLLLGEAYLRHDMLPEALQETRTAAALKPGYSEAANNLGQIYSQLNQPDKAAGQYRLAIQYAQNIGLGFAVARAYNNLAYELKRLGQTGDAILTYRKAIEINPQFSGAYNNLGYLFFEQNQYEEAEKNLLRALQLEPASSNAASNLGLVYARMGKLDLATAYLNEAVRLEPRSGETFARLGEVALARGDRGQAQQLFRHALELHPDNKRAAAGLDRIVSEKTR